MLLLCISTSSKYANIFTDKLIDKMHRMIEAQYVFRLTITKGK